MDRSKLFKLLANDAPRIAAEYLIETYCWSILCVYRIDASKLSATERKRVIEIRVEQLRELQPLYQWLKDQAHRQARSRHQESLTHLDHALVEFAEREGRDAKRIVLQVTGWSEIQFSALQHDLV